MSLLILNVITLHERNKIVASPTTFSIITFCEAEKVTLHGIVQDKREAYFQTKIINEIKIVYCAPRAANGLLPSARQFGVCEPETSNANAQERDGPSPKVHTIFSIRHVPIFASLYASKASASMPVFRHDVNVCSYSIKILKWT